MNNFLYTNMATHITVGTNVEQGLVWRISARSQLGAVHSEPIEEIAFRTVLTVQIAGMAENALGWPLTAG